MLKAYTSKASLMGARTGVWTFRAILLLVVLASPVILCAQAQTSTQGACPPPLDSSFKPAPGTYYYKFDFNRVGIGIASIAISREDDLYRVKVLAQTNSTIDRIYRIRYRGESVLDTSPVVSPVITTSVQQVGSKEKDMTIRFDKDGEIKTVEKKSEKGATVDYEVRNLQTDRFIVDPFAATYLVRGFDWKVGREEVFDVYGGKSRYELRFRCTDRKDLDEGGLKRAAYVIVPKITKLDKDGRVVPPKKKPVDIRIYISADELKDVLKVEVSHTMGLFTATMDRFVPLVPQVREAAPAAQATSTPAQGGEAP
jgi:hypothetical protein